MASRSGKYKLVPMPPLSSPPIENILLEHEFADVFEADRDFVEFAIVFGGELVDEFGDGESFGDFAVEACACRRGARRAARKSDVD